MSGRPQGRSRQPRRERSQRTKGRDHSADSVSSTTSSRSERDRNGRNSRRRGDRKDERSRKPEEKGKESREKDGARGNITEKARRPEKFPASRDGKGDNLSRGIQSRESPRDGSNLKNLDHQNLFADDSRLSHLMRRVTHESDHDRRLTAANQLEEFFCNPENFQITIKSADNILIALEDVLYERGFLDLKEQVARCTGIVGSLLGFDARRYFQWIFKKLDSASSEDLKILLLISLAKAVQMDSSSQMFRESIVNVMSNLQNILENVDSSDLLRAVLNIVIPIAVDYPYAFAGHFRDTVDILVGWHIDTSQHDSVTKHTSDCLIQLHPYWASDMAFSLTLLGQFLEDMEAYAEELTMLANNEVGKDDMPSPYMSLPKLTALIKVFTTVVNGIGSFFTPAKSPSITQTYLREIMQRVIQCVNMSGYSFYYEKLFISANECLEVMCGWLQSYFSCCCDLVSAFVFQQLQSTTPLPYSHTLSIVKFLHQIVEKVSTAIPLTFVQQLLQPLSPVMKLRLSSDKAVLSSLMEVYQGFLGIPDVPLLEGAYRTAVSELKSSYWTIKERIRKYNGQEETKTQQLQSRPDVEPQKEQDEMHASQITMENNKDVEMDVSTPGYSIQEIETIIIFDLCALVEIATSKSAVLGLWKLSPTPFELLTQVLSPCDWDVASCFPSVQYTILHTLYTHSQRQHHFLPSSSVGGLLKITEGSSNGDILTIFKLLSKVLKNSSTSEDSRKLCFVWLVEVLDRCHTIDALLMVGQYYNFDSLAQDLLPLTFSQHTNTSLDVCQCLQILVDLKLLSNDCLTRCLQDCIIRISDRSETVRNWYLELLKSLPTDILTGFAARHLLRSQGIQKETKAIGRVITTSCKDMWGVRKSHMSNPPTGSFHSNNFQVIMNFILHDIPPGNNIKSDWLLRLFDSCNRPNKYLKSEIVHFSRCEVLQWFWVIWEAAQFCVLSRLRTPLGRAQETFQAIEGVLKKYACEAKNPDNSVDEGIKLKLSNNDSTAEKEDDTNSVLGPLMYVSPLRSVLLLRFVEDLEKLMYNAFEGCAVGLPSPPKSVRIFFRTNRGTCQEWLTRIRDPVMEIGIANGSPALTVLHGFHTLDDLVAAKNTQGRDFAHVVGLVAKALCQLKSSEALDGLITWAHSVSGQRFSWMNGIVSKAKGCFEKAVKEYQDALNEPFLSSEGPSNDSVKVQTNGNSLEPEVAEFLVNEVVDCYIKLSDWSEVDAWQKHISNLRKQTSDTNLQHSLSVNVDMNYVKALGTFEECNFISVKDHLQLIPGAALNSVTESINKSPWAGSGHGTSDGQLFNPCWGQEQIAQASQLALMQAETMFWIAHTSGMPNNKKKDVSGSKDVKVLQVVKDFIKQSEMLAVGALRVGVLDWPPHISACHALTLQYAATLKNFITSGSQEASENPLVFLHGDGTFLGDPTQHDCSVLNQATCFAQHMQQLALQQTAKHDETTKMVSTLQLATARLARKHSNYRLAQKRLVQQLKLLGASVKLPKGTKNNLVEPLVCGLSSLPKNCSFSMVELLKVKRECAKLAFALGHTTEAVCMLCDGVSEFSSVGQYDWSISNLNARSLLTLSRWLLADRKLLISVTKQNGNGNISISSKINALCDIELNYQGCGQSVLVPKITGTQEEFSGLEGNSSVAAGVNDLESICGQLLHLSTMQSPDLGKAWYSLAGWCYRWGRKTVEQASSSGAVELLPKEKAKIKASLPEGLCEDDVDSVLTILGQAHSSAMAFEGEDIGNDEQEYHDAIGITKKQLFLSCASLQQVDECCLDNLLSVWKNVQDRTFKHYHFAVKAYFMYLRMGDKSSRRLSSENCEREGHSWSGGSVDDDSNVTATLRLLRLLVKHAGELRTELEDGLANTPTRPWKDITPQLFSRLNHPESYVRQSVSDLLCRVAKDATHLIVFPAVVGCSSVLPHSHTKDKDGEGASSYIPTLPVWVPNSDDREPNDDGSQDSEKPATRCDSDTALQSCFLSIVDSLRSDNPQLISEIQGFIQELRRVTLLWEELWHGSLIQTHQDVTRRQQQLEEEVKRVMNNPNLTGQQKSTLIKEKHIAIMKPVLFGLEQLHAITSNQAHTPHEEWFQKTYSAAIEKALEALRNPVEPTKPKASWEPFKQLLQALQSRSQKRSSYLLRMEDISPYLTKIKSSAIYMPGQTQFSGQVVTIDSIVSEVTILPTKTKPKKIVFIGSDNRRHSFLFKGLEDLHLDERIMQFLSICNNMFARHDSHSSPLFQARHYSVTPLGPKSGLIKWVDGSVPVFALYKRWQQRESAAVALVKTTQGANPPPPQPLRPSEMFYNKMTPALKEKGVTDLSNRKEWPLPVMRKVLEELIAETPKDLLAKELWCSSTGASEWWHLVQSYARSTAVMSMIGYIIGLGDRHLDNMLIDFTTGEVVHIDYNVCFDKGKSLRVPEKVPFRMTPNLQEALGVTGVEGIFRLSCEQVLKILRQGRETLLTLLEAFVYDPLVDWTTANDGAFASAFYGGGAPGAAENKVNKKEMERAVTQSLFSSRVAEMKVNWTANRDEMLTALTNLEESVDVFVSSVSVMKSLDQNAEELKEQQETLRDALNNPQHSLHSAQAKFDERARVQVDHERVMQSIKEKLAECQNWQKQHEISMETVRGQQLASLAAEILQPLELGLPSFAPAINFLQGAGQGHIVTQCEKLETELSGLLHQRRAVLRSCLDLLHTYATVTSQFPVGFVQYNRSAEWKNWLEILANDSSTQKCREVLLQKETLHAEGKDQSGAPSITTITALMSMEVKLQSNLTEQNPKFIKFCERRKQENVETATISKTVSEALKNLKQFLSEKKATALKCLTCVVLTALCALNKRCLVMENTAKVAGERLSDLTSREGDWFLDELCSMSGNVTQLLVLLKDYPLDGASDEGTAGEVQEGIKAVLSVHRVFVALQELVSNFRTIIVPEAVKSIHAEETTVLSMMDKLVHMTTTKKFTLKQIATAITAHLKGNAPPEAPSTEEIKEFVYELQEEFDQLQQTFPTGPVKDASTSMTAGQMLLAGFNGLFTKVENELASLQGLVRTLTVDQKDQNLDVVKESQNLSIDIAEKEADLLFMLFFVKRLEVMISFFVAARLMTLTLRGCAVKENILPGVLEAKDIASLFKIKTVNREVIRPQENQEHWNAEHCYSEEDLASYVKHFTAQCVQQRIMGLPSKALAAVVAKYIGILGGDVALEAEGVKDGIVMSEEMCKKVVDLNIKKGSFHLKQMTKVSSLTSAYDVGWRKHDFARRLDTSITVYKGVVQRAQLQLARFQWLYEDNLVRCPMRGNNMISPARATVMADLRKRMQALVQMDTAVKAVEERFVAQESSIEQRLKWAAGANPALNPVLQNFDKALGDRKKLLLVEVKRSSEICALCNTILHFEALRTYTSDAASLDKAMTTLVKKCEESSGHLEKSIEKLKEVEEVTRKVKVGYPPESPITREWMMLKLDQVAGQIASHKSRKMQAISSVTANRDVLKTQGSCLRAVMVAHKQLISEVKSMLTTMAKDDEAPESQAAKSFIANHNALAEESAQLIKNILSVCSGKVDVEKGVGLPEDGVKDLKENIKTVAAYVQWVHDHLYALASPIVSDEAGSTSGKTPIVAPPATFASALRQGNPPPHPGPVRKDSNQSDSPAAVTQAQAHSTILQHEFASPDTPPASKLATAVASPRRGSKEPYIRDPRTGKAIQERNLYAVGVWRRVKNKLDGRDVDVNKRMSVQDQVDSVIRESTSLDNLAQMYEGWTAWV